jgi:hypothetical protein
VAGLHRIAPVSQKKRDSRFLLVASALAIFCLLSTAIVLYIYHFGYIPLVRAGPSEIIDFYIQSWNLTNTPSWKNFFLTDLGINDPHSLQGSNIYTHNPNSHRVIGAMLIALGFVNIQAQLIAGCIVGIIAIAAAFWFFIDRCRTPLVAVSILLFIVTDYSTVDQVLNPYRTWHYSLFFFVVSSVLVDEKSSLGHDIIPGAASFLAFQYDYMFAFFPFFAGLFVVLTGRESLRHKKKVALSFFLGAAVSIAVSLAQLVAHFGSVHALTVEAFNTWRERNTVLYPQRPTFDSHLLTTTQLIETFSLGAIGPREIDWIPAPRAAQQFYIPADFLEYLRYVVAAFYAYYRYPIAMLSLWLALIGIGIASCRLLGVMDSLVSLRAVGVRLFYLPISRITLGCLISLLALGFVAPGHIAYMYFMLRYPMLNLVAFLLMISMMMLATELIREGVGAISTNLQNKRRLVAFLCDHSVGFSAAVTISITAVILLNTNGGWLKSGSIVSANFGAQEFYLLEKYAVKGSPIATNAHWPLTGIIHGITGRRPINVESAESISPEDRQFKLFLCHASEVKCNIGRYAGPYTILGSDSRFALVELN